MLSPISLENTITVRQAYLIMFAFLEREWELLGRPVELGGLLGSLSLWETESGEKEPMDAAVFPEWVACAKMVLESEENTIGNSSADILIDGKPPTTKVQR